MHIFALLAALPIFVQALPTEYTRGVSPRTEYDGVFPRGGKTTKAPLTDKDFFQSCPGGGGSPNVQGADRCTLVNIQNNPDQIIFKNIGDSQLNCNGGTSPTSVSFEGSTSVSTTTTADMNVGISFEDITIGGGISTSDTQTTVNSKTIAYTVPPGRQAILTAGSKYHSQTGNVQVNYGDQINGHYIWFTDAKITKLIPAGGEPAFQIHETKCGTDASDVNNKS